MYFGRGQTILTRRENIKLKTIELRRRPPAASPDRSLNFNTEDQILS
jgi:hypothetical protein